MRSRFRWRLAVSDDLVASKGQEAYRTAKRFALENVLKAMDDAGPAGEEPFLDCWFSDEARQRISRVVATLGR